MNSEEWMNTVRNLTKSQKTYKEDSELKNTTEKKKYTRLESTDQMIQRNGSANWKSEWGKSPKLNRKKKKKVKIDF